MRKRDQRGGGGKSRSSQVAFSDGCVAVALGDGHLGYVGNSHGSAIRTAAQDCENDGKRTCEVNLVLRAR